MSFSRSKSRNQSPDIDKKDIYTDKKLTDIHNNSNKEKKILNRNLSHTYLRNSSNINKNENNNYYKYYGNNSKESKKLIGSNDIKNKFRNEYL